MNKVSTWDTLEKFTNILNLIIICTLKSSCKESSWQDVSNICSEWQWGKPTSCIWIWCWRDCWILYSDKKAILNFWKKAQWKKAICKKILPTKMVRKRRRRIKTIRKHSILHKHNLTSTMKPTTWSKSNLQYTCLWNPANCGRSLRSLPKQDMILR